MSDFSVTGPLQTFPTEFPVFKREHLDGMYRTDVYFICKTMADVSVSRAVFTDSVYK